LTIFTTIGLKELFLKHRDANTMDFIVGAEIYDHLEKGRRIGSTTWRTRSIVL